MDKQRYPKFIQNSPHGIDKYEGRSAEILATAIGSHIESVKDCNDDTNKLPQIIGLDGEWGSGKSNVVRILKNRTNIKDKYYLFEYDAWGHQEDLQRRSFLETLTEDLIAAENGKLLPEKCTKKNKDNKCETWQEKLKDLLARKRETNSKTKPKISAGITGAILLFIFTPISSAIASDKDLCIWIKLLIAFSPIIIALIVWGICSWCKKRFIWSELFEIYSNEKIENIVNETISESEPSVREFCHWMDDLSHDLKKKLIIVFDNMDRLPAEKVKELWSSIHTFFAESRYPNIWIIITFDRKHLANAFGNEDNNTELTNHFINKTFPVIYRVAPPIMTDWKKIFNEYFEEAFSHTEDENKKTIQRIFGIIKLHFTPRDIIAFINELVTLKRTWKDEIPLLPIAIFTLKKDEILKEPVGSILSGEYLKSINKIIDNNELLQSFIAALTYGIDVKMAQQIPLKQYLQSILKGETKYDINQYSGNTHFVEILDDEIKNLDPAIIDKAIIGLSKLDRIKGVEVTPQWNDLVKLHLQQQIVQLALEDTHKALLLHADDINKNEYMEYLCSGFRQLKEFKGALFFITMQQIDNYIKENKLNIIISNFIETKKVTPDIFIEYVNQAKNDYQQFKLTCDNKEFNDYLVGLFPVNLPQMDFIEFLVNDESYSFDILESRIESAITGNEIDANNFPAIIKTYKLISKEYPLKQQFTTNQIQTLLNVTEDKTSEAYYDLVTMALSHKVVDIPYVEGLDEKVAERGYFYNDYDNLLLLAKDWNSELFRKSVKIMTEKSYGRKMDIKTILPFFEEIKTAIDVSADIFLNEIAAWEKSTQDITIENIETLVPKYSFYEYSSKINNQLTTHINTIAIKKLENIPIEDLYAQRNEPSYYWLNCAALLIQGGIIKILSNNLTEFCKRILIAISNGEQSVPIHDSIIDIITKKADKRNLHTTIKNICVDFCNKKITITPALFLFFTTEFNFINKVTSRDGDISSIILNTVITDSNCLNYILENNTDYIRIINNSGDDANDLKATIRQLRKTNKSEKLQEFATAIGIEEPKIEIIKAEYWTLKNRLDVTEELRKMIVDNKLETVASNEIKDDPDKGTPKNLLLNTNSMAIQKQENSQKTTKY